MPNANPIPPGEIMNLGQVSYLFAFIAIIIFLVIFFGKHKEIRKKFIFTLISVLIITAIIIFLSHFYPNAYDEEDFLANFLGIILIVYTVIITVFIIQMIKFVYKNKK